MRDLTVEELGHVYGVGGDSKPMYDHKNKGSKGSKQHASRGSKGNRPYYG